LRIRPRSQRTRGIVNLVSHYIARVILWSKIEPGSKGRLRDGKIPSAVGHR